MELRGRSIPGMAKTTPFQVPGSAPKVLPEREPAPEVDAAHGFGVQVGAHSLEGFLKGDREPWPERDRDPQTFSGMRGGR